MENFLAADKSYFDFIEIALVVVMDPRWQPLLFTKLANRKHVKRVLLYCNNLYSLDARLTSLVFDS